MGWIGYISIVGVGAAGTAGVGTTGWNLYEELRPTVLKRQERKGYKYIPVEPPGERKPADPKSNKFSWASGGCFQRLFPGVEVKHDDPTKGQEKPSNGVPLSPTDDTTYQAYIGCTTMEMSPWGETSNQIYYKSETVIKNDQVGMAIWTGLSTNPNKVVTRDSGSQARFDLFYKVIFLKKEEDGWKVKWGYRWIVEDRGNNQNDRYFLKTPDQSWIEDQHYDNWGNIPDKSWSGVWEPVKQESSGGNHPLKGITLYVQQNNEQGSYDQIFGADDPFSNEYTSPPESDSQVAVGYNGATVWYDPIENAGWKEMSSPSYHNAQSDLYSWYAPFKTQNGKWSELKTRCNAISRNRSAQARFSEELMNLCFTSEKTEITIA